MEPFFDNLKKAQESKFEIIGKEHQSIQFVLYSGESVETYASCLLYMSSNIKKKNKGQGLKDSFMNFLSNNQGEVEFYNDTDTIGYIGISRRIGKVIVINAILNNDICFKSEHLLAYTSGMVQDKAHKVLELGLRPWNRFKFTLNTKGKLPQIFLQSSNGLIEKELAANEEIILNRGSVFAFSQKIKFSFPQTQLKHFTSLVKAKGPGLIYIENKHDSTNPLQNYKKGFIPIIIFWIYILLSLLLWYLGALQI